MITLTAAFVFLGLSGTTAAVQGGSFSLGFATLPVVFAHMGAFENIIGALWFFMLFLAAITSSLSMYQPAVAHVKESLGLTHTRATSIIATIGFIGAMLTLWFTAGGSFWNTVDFWVGTYLIFVLAMVQIIYFSWVFGIERGWKEIHNGASIRIPPVFKIVMKYIAPMYLIIVFIGFTLQNFRSALAASWANTGARAGMLTIAGILIFLLYVTRKGETRMRAAGMDVDDTKPAD
jgi:NSS family neurotransmitter:Na+ symporter